MKLLVNITSSAKCSDHTDRCHDLSLCVLYGIR